MRVIPVLDGLDTSSEDRKMKDAQFRSFGDLYRAAYAESNPERKALLLSQVRRALDEWEQGLRNTEIPFGPKSSHGTDILLSRPPLVA
jgi:hypothetical protein